MIWANIVTVFGLGLVYLAVLSECSLRIGKKGTAIALVVMVLALIGTVVIGPGYRLFSVQPLCYRPQDVMTTARIYDEVTDTWIQYIPTWGRCEPLNFPGEVGRTYLRLQWR